MNPSNRVAFNTGILYCRMILTVGITLYTTRLVLDALGGIDFGIFNLIAGIIVMLSFLNGAMATSTQRYLSYYQGKKDQFLQAKVFRNSLIIHFFIGIFVVIVLELLGFFLLNGFLNIPIDRIEAAKIVYHLMSLTVFFTILSVPFNGVLMAHENMLWIAVINISESILKLIIALMLFRVSGDKLIVYAILTQVISVVSLILYSFYCFRSYAECVIPNNLKIDRDISKELTSFAGWNLFGALCGIGKTQGLAVLLNVFFGTVVNAAYGISNQVAGQLNFFSSTMLRAINPQIMKSEGLNDRPRMIKLSMIASKFGFLLLAVIAIPCIFEMQTILGFWLKEVPAYASSFCSFILVAFMINQLTIGLDSAAQATGKIKGYMLYVGSIKLLILPSAYCLLALDFSIYSIFYVYILLEGLAGICRIFILKNLIHLSIKSYMNNVINPLIIPIVLTLLIDYIFYTNIHAQLKVLYFIMASISTMGISVYFLGLKDYEKNIIKKIFDKFLLKLKLNNC